MSDEQKIEDLEEEEADVEAHLQDLGAVEGNADIGAVEGNADIGAAETPRMSDL